MAKEIEKVEKEMQSASGGGRSDLWDSFCLSNVRVSSMSFVLSQIRPM